MSTARKKGARVRIVPPHTRNPSNKDPQEEIGEDREESEDEPAEDNDSFEGQEPIDLASIDKNFRKMKKQMTEMTQYMTTVKLKCL
jgi:hypothetical protein